MFFIILGRRGPMSSRDLKENIRIVSSGKLAAKKKKCNQLPAIIRRDRWSATVTRLSGCLSPLLSPYHSWILLRSKLTGFQGYYCICNVHTFLLFTSPRRACGWSVTSILICSSISWVLRFGSSTALGVFAGCDHRSGMKILVAG